MVPRKNPSEFQKFEVPKDLPTLMMAHVESADGQGDDPLYMTLNGKVIEIGYVSSAQT